MTLAAHVGKSRVHKTAVIGRGLSPWLPWAVDKSSTALTDEVAAAAIAAQDSAGSRIVLGNLSPASGLVGPSRSETVQNLRYQATARTPNAAGVEHVRGSSCEFEWVFRIRVRPGVATEIESMQFLGTGGRLGDMGLRSGQQMLPKDTMQC